MNIYRFINVQGYEVNNHVVVATNLESAKELVKHYYTAPDGELDDSFGDIQLTTIIPIYDGMLSQLIC